MDLRQNQEDLGATKNDPKTTAIHSYPMLLLSISSSYPIFFFFFPWNHPSCEAQKRSGTVSATCCTENAKLGTKTAARKTHPHSTQTPLHQSFLEGQELNSLLIYGRRIEMLCFLWVVAARQLPHTNVWNRMKPPHNNPWKASPWVAQDSLMVNFRSLNNQKTEMKNKINKVIVNWETNKRNQVISENLVKITSEITTFVIIP